MIANDERISVIIPTYNEAATIAELVKSLRDFGGSALADILVVDAGSADQTIRLAEEAGANVLRSARAGRAIQMNLGAEAASGAILYFVHADTRIHPDFVEDIRQALREGYEVGCYRYQFDAPSPMLLRFNAYCTRFDRIWCRGGDQTLFIRKRDFERLGAFREDHRIMEDYEFILRSRPQFRFKIIPKNVVVSARKYKQNSYFRVNFANFIVFLMYFMGFSQDRLIATYKTLIRTEKYGVEN
jgi:rSAM/selenodomain-associated transferase 2